MIFWGLPVLAGKVAVAWTLLASPLEGWPGRTLSVLVNPTDCTISETDLLSHIDTTLAIWNGVSVSGLTIRRNPVASSVTPTDFDSGAELDGPIIFCDSAFGSSIGDEDYVPAATVVPGAGNGLTRAAIYLNAQSGSGADISGLSTDVFQIALAHEMGHMLGLGHSVESSSLMYYSVGGKDHARLTEDDEQGLSFLYPRNEFIAGAFGCASVPGTAANPWSVGIVIAYLMCLLLVVRHFSKG